MSSKNGATLHPLHAERIKPVGHLPCDMYMGEWSAHPRPADLDKPPAPPPMQTPPCLLAGSEAGKERAARLLRGECE